MRQMSYSAAAMTLVAVLASTASAKALAIAVPNRPAQQQAITADVIVVGKVIEIEKEMTQASQFPGQPNKVDYHVAVLKISENLHGAKGLTNVRVGFLPAPKVAPDAAPGPIGGPIRRPIRRPFPTVSLTEGQEGCFCLNKHHDGDFYVISPQGQPLDKKAADFDKQLDQVKKVVKTLDDPLNSLKAKDLADRQLAAHVLIQKYRMYPPNAGNKQPTQQDIPAEESKLILQTMAAMDWNKFDPQGGPSVQNMFGMLGVQQGQHDFNPPKFQPGQQDYAKVYGDYVMKWIKDNAEKYHIQKWVVAK
jgi:hypothetical protein